MWLCLRHNRLVADRPNGSIWFVQATMGGLGLRSPNNFRLLRGVAKLSTLQSGELRKSALGWPVGAQVNAAKISPGVALSKSKVHVQSFDKDSVVLAVLDLHRKEA